MKENETVVEMITRFTNIVNGLEAISIKVTYKGHRNSRTKRLDQATYGGARRVINDI